MGIEALLSTQIIDTTTVGRAVMTAADAAAARTAIGAGTSSFSGAYSALSGIPSTFAPSAHKTSHATGGSDALTAADIGAAATSHTHAASDITSGIIGTARLATGTANSTTYLRGDQTWATVAAAGVGGSTGAVDNAVLRADGTGGSTVQSSDWIITDNYTASPNNTVNHASIQATGSTTNVSISIVPKGTGAFCLAVPDGTATGGNARGANAIDLQTVRTAATQVASGANAVAVGVNSTASSTNGIAIGNGAVSTGGGNGRSIAVGLNATASTEYAIAIGTCTASGTGAICISTESGSASGACATAIGPAGVTASGGCSIAIGGAASTSRTNEVAFGFRHALFDVRPGAFLLSCKTTDANFTTLGGNNVFQSAIAWTTRSGTVIQGILQVLGAKSDGSAVASYTRKVIFKNVGGTITLVQSETIGTDFEDNASTDIEITNATPFFRVKGIASETWRWSGWFGPTLEMAYGT